MLHFIRSTVRKTLLYVIISIAIFRFFYLSCISFSLLFLWPFSYFIFTSRPSYFTLAFPPLFYIYCFSSFLFFSFYIFFLHYVKFSLSLLAFQNLSALVSFSSLFLISIFIFTRPIFLLPAYYSHCLIIYLFSLCDSIFYLFTCLFTSFLFRMCVFLSVVLHLESEISKHYLH